MKSSYPTIQLNQNLVEAKVLLVLNWGPIEVVFLEPIIGSTLLSAGALQWPVMGKMPH